MCECGGFSYAPQGWECPRCHRVYSPSTMMCMYCGFGEETWTSCQATINPNGEDATPRPDVMGGKIRRPKESFTNPWTSYGKTTVWIPQEDEVKDNE